MDGEKPEKSVKRPIDRKRDSGGSFKLGKPEDGPTDLMVEIEGSLYIVRRKGIYAIQMADRIDPERTNFDLPNVIPRHIFSEGSESELVGQTFLTAAGLLKKGKFLPLSFPHEKALALSLDALTNMIGMRSVASEFDLAQQEASLSAQKATQETNAYQLPHMAEAKSIFKTFSQRADHAAISLFEIAKFFYPELGKGGWDALLTLAEEKYGADNFTDFLSEALPFLKMIRAMRNALEHNRPEGIVTNFELLKEGVAQVPSFEMKKYQDSEIPLTAISSLMANVFQNLPVCFEIMLVHMCGKLPVTIPLPFPFGIGMPKEERRPIKTVKYYYGTVANGEFTPIG